MFPIIYSEDFLQHKTGRYHPEKSGRLSAIVGALQKAPWVSQISWQLPTPLDTRDVLYWVQTLHNSSYVEKVKKIAQRGGGMLDPDTAISTKSYNVALLAVSAWLDGVDQVLGHNSPAFVLARPPGHHAERDTGMGFCLFSNAAIAAYYALEKGNINRVAILDWDVHHGNGTQSLVESNSQIIYCSLHQFPCYPGTGNKDEQGMYNNILNIPMDAGSKLEDYQQAFEHQVIPFLRNFQPDLLIVSAGYDANADDPLAGISLQPQDYKVLTNYCLTITPRILFGLEGGYDFEALSKSVVATIDSVMENQVISR
jgi:acetoin utilization deacetylase AcuC-like enzyme